jgi:hypothetical protein
VYLDLRGHTGNRSEQLCIVRCGKIWCYWLTWITSNKRRILTYVQKEEVKDKRWRGMGGRGGKKVVKGEESRQEEVSTTRRQEGGVWYSRNGDGEKIRWSRWKPSRYRRWSGGRTYKEDKKSVTTFGRRGCFLCVHRTVRKRTTVASRRLDKDEPRGRKREDDTRYSQKKI